MVALFCNAEIDNNIIVKLQKSATLNTTQLPQQKQRSQFVAALQIAVRNVSSMNSSHSTFGRPKKHEFSFNLYFFYVLATFS